MPIESILADQHPDCWGAMDFVDNKMKAIIKTVVIESIGMGKPPGGGAERVYFVFKNDHRKAFLKKTARVFIAVKLSTLDPKDLIGCAMKITATMARSHKGGEVLSMTVVDAVRPKSRQQGPSAPVESSSVESQQREPGED